MGAIINKKSTTTEPLPQNGQQPKPSGVPNAFHQHQTLAPDSAAAEVQEMFRSHGGHLTNAMYHHGEIKLTHHDETKKRAVTHR